MKPDSVSQCRKQTGNTSKFVAGILSPKVYKRVESQGLSSEKQEHEWVLMTLFN